MSLNIITKYTQRCKCSCVQHMHILLTAVRPEIKLFSTCPDTPLFFMYGCSRRPAPRRVKFLMAAVDGETKTTSQFLPHTRLLSCSFTNHTLHYYLFFIFNIFYLFFFLVFLQPCISYHQAPCFYFNSNFTETTNITFASQNC